MTSAPQPRVGVIMGSDSDWSVMEDAAQALVEFDVPFEVGVVSAHRTPGRMLDYARTAAGRGIDVIIAEATMPGRCAAPPAPAMITSMPRPAALCAYSNMRPGVRCAETTPTSNGTSNSASACAASSITDQSLSLPMITPTRGSGMFTPSVGPFGVR